MQDSSCSSRLEARQTPVRSLQTIEASRPLLTGRGACDIVRHYKKKSIWRSQCLIFYWLNTHDLRLPAHSLEEVSTVTR